MASSTCISAGINNLCSGIIYVLKSKSHLDLNLKHLNFANQCSIGLDWNYIQQNCNHNLTTCLACDVSLLKFFRLFQKCTSSVRAVEVSNCILSISGCMVIRVNRGKSPLFEPLTVPQSPGPSLLCWIWMKTQAGETLKIN